LNSNKLAIQSSVTRLIGYISRISVYVDILLENKDVIYNLSNLLSHPHKYMRLTICWIFSNIAGCEQNHINKIIENE
jgi:hypothetical protein